MANPRDLLTFHVDSDYRVSVVCPVCHHKKIHRASTFKSGAKAFKTMCTCGHVFIFAVEYRKFFRKRVDIKGHCRNLSNNTKARMTIKDMSLGGIGFSPSLLQKIEKGDELELTFSLPNASTTVITRNVRAITVRERFVGGIFTDAAPSAELSAFIYS